MTAATGRSSVAPAPVLNPDLPLARRDAPYSGDSCGNGGGLDQDIYGVRLLLP